MLNVEVRNVDLGANCRYENIKSPFVISSFDIPCSTFDIQTIFKFF